MTQGMHELVVDSLHFYKIISQMSVELLDCQKAKRIYPGSVNRGRGEKAAYTL